MPQTAAPPPPVQVLPAADVRELMLRLPCEESLSVSDRAFAMTPAVMAHAEASLRADVEAVRRGASMRGLLLPRACESEYERGFYSALDAAGAEHRVLRQQAARFVVINRSVVVVDTGYDDRAMIIRAPGAVRSFVAAFEALWSQSVARGSARRRDDDDGRLLDLLAEGRTDASIGRCLGVSERTVRRRVTALLEEHEARSRFELGLVLSTRAAASPPAHAVRAADAIAP